MGNFFSIGGKLLWPPFSSFLVASACSTVCTVREIFSFAERVRESHDPSTRPIFLRCPEEAGTCGRVRGTPREAAAKNRCSIRTPDTDFRCTLPKSWLSSRLCTLDCCRRLGARSFSFESFLFREGPTHQVSAL